MAELRYREVRATRAAVVTVGGDSRDHSYQGPQGESLASGRPDPDENEDDDVETDDDARTRHDVSSSRPSSRMRSGVAPRRREPEAPDVGTVVLGKYRIEQIVEETDTAVITRAVHLGLEQLVTLKYLLPSVCVRAEVVAQFLRGARTASQLQNEHVARVVDVGRTRDGIPFVVTEELSGWELDEVLRVRGPLPVQEAVEYVIQASEAVAEAHSLGILHGALNLANLVLTRRVDESPLVKVLGFGDGARGGRASLGDEAAALMGVSGFTAILPYFSPEQIRGSDALDERTDVWALGALLHTLIAGSPPFRGKSSIELLAVVCADPPRRLSELRDDIAPDLDACVARCLEKDRGARFAHLGEFVQTLKPFASGDALGSVERISRLYGRGTKPPPLPGARGRAIVSVPPPPDAAKSTAPAAASETSAARRGFLVAAVSGMIAGSIGALIIGVALRSELGALVRPDAPIPVVAPPAATLPALPAAIAGSPSPAPVSVPPVVRPDAHPAAPAAAAAIPASAPPVAMAVGAAPASPPAADARRAAAPPRAEAAAEYSRGAASPATALVAATPLARPPAAARARAAPASQDVERERVAQAPASREPRAFAPATADLFDDTR